MMPLAFREIPPTMDTQLLESFEDIPRGTSKMLRRLCLAQRRLLRKMKNFDTSQ